MYFNQNVNISNPEKQRKNMKKKGTLG